MVEITILRNLKLKWNTINSSVSSPYRLQSWVVIRKALKKRNEQPLATSCCSKMDEEKSVERRKSGERNRQRICIAPVYIIKRFVSTNTFFLRYGRLSSSPRSVALKTPPEPERVITWRETRVWYFDTAPVVPISTSCKKDYNDDC